MRTRGASVSMILKLAACEAVLVGVGGSLLGGVLVFALTELFKIGLGVSLTNVTGWLLRATCVALLLALFAVLQPAWQEARLATVATARRFPFAIGQPLWRRVWLDAVLLAVAAVDLWWMAGGGYELVFAPEGSASVSVHYEAFAGPFCLWIGAMLATLRLFGWLLQRGLPLAVKFRLPFFTNKLSPLMAASLARQRLPLSRAMGLVALALSFAVSTAIFNATYQAQSRVDAALTNGADVTVSGIPSATLASGLLSKLEKLPAAVAARAMQHAYAYVGNDLQDLYGIDPKTLGDATPLANAYFEEGSASSALKALDDQPDGILVSAETVTDFQLHRGDRLNIRLRLGPGNVYQNVSFRFIGVVREFPTAPKDSFLVVNSAYLLSQAPAGLDWTILIRSKGDPSPLAQSVSRVVGPIAGARVNDVVSAQGQISSSLTAVDLRGLTLLELSFAVAFAVGASGLSLFLSFSERRRSFAILTALGAKRRHLEAFMWSEAATVLIGGGLVGTGVGCFVAFALIKVLGGVFDPPPEGLTVPWIYLFSLGISAAALTAAGVEFLLRTLVNKPVIGELRSWV
jgi:putative ABC transport system permease protein